MRVLDDSCGTKAFLVRSDFVIEFDRDNKDS